jgi:hypothetical protein
LGNRVFVDDVVEANNPSGDNRCPVCLIFVPTRIVMRSPNLPYQLIPFFTLPLYSLTVIEVCIGVSITRYFYLMSKNGSLFALGGRFRD